MSEETTYRQKWKEVFYQLESMRDFLDFLESEYLPMSIGELWERFEAIEKLKDRHLKPQR